MSTEIKNEVIDITYHRNGICGASFHAIIFDSTESGTKNRMVGVVFEEPAHVAVFNLNLLSKGDIRFGYNSFRGDRFEDDLRRFISTYEEKLMSTIMSDSLFKKLTVDEENGFREWARDPVNHTQEHWEKRGIYHPVIRDEWEKIGFKGE